MIGIFDGEEYDFHNTAFSKVNQRLQLSVLEWLNVNRALKMTPYLTP